MAAKQDPGLRSNAPARPADPIDLDSSVAGEEDPGASIDLANVRPRGTEGRADQPAGQASAGTPSNGEEVCPECGGTGRLGASKCPNCLGTGVVIIGLGGA